MFTGIIEQKGVVRAIEHKANLIVLKVDVSTLSSKIQVGDSVSNNGVCLTVTQKKGRVVSFDLMKETIEKTSLRELKVGSPLNLELALLAQGRLGGHFVSGHVDEVGIIKKIEKAPNWVSMTISVSKQNRRYIVSKGSVAIDGISLTVGKVHLSSFEVYLIPYTLEVTNLGVKKVGDRVNIETDILAKYVFSK